MYLTKYNFGEDYRVWNPWFGCSKLSEACENCYIRPYGRKFEDLFYSFPHSDAKEGTFITVCLQSDFFLAEADSLRPSAWLAIKNNPHLIFLIITKRVDRVSQCLPNDWGEGYDNVIICATVENQKRADERIPLLLELPAKHKWVTCSPLLEPIDLTEYLHSGQIEFVEISGERTCSMPARPTKYEWVEDIYKTCVKYDVRCYLFCLGHNFIMPEETVLCNWGGWHTSEVADSLGIMHYKPITFKLSTTEVTY